MAAFSSIALGFLAAATAGSAVMNYQNQKKQLNAQNQAAQQASAQAKAQASQAEQANNKANQKAPNISSMMSANEQAANAGMGSTMLTGSQGVDPNNLSLGKSSLLGG